MKKMTKKQVITAAIKIAKNAVKDLDKIMTENDMFYDPIHKSWDEAPFDHTKDEHGNWENVKIINKRDPNGIFFELIDGEDINGYVENLLYTRKELEEYILVRQSECSPANRIKNMQDEINRLKKKYNIKD